MGAKVELREVLNASDPVTLPRGMASDQPTFQVVHVASFYCR